MPGQGRPGAVTGPERRAGASQLADALGQRIDRKRLGRDMHPGRQPFVADHRIFGSHVAAAGIDAVVIGRSDPRYPAIRSIGVPQAAFVLEQDSAACGGVASRL